MVIGGGRVYAWCCEGRRRKAVKVAYDKVFGHIKWPSGICSKGGR